MTSIKVPPTAADIVLRLAHHAKHSDNLSEFVEYLAEAWREVGLPGELPMDRDGFIDTPEPDTGEYAALSRGFGAIEGLEIESEWVTAHVAVFLSVERSADVGKIADAATTSGLEAYEFRRDVVVVRPEPRQ